MTLHNPALARYPFLAGMYRDGYFPDPLVDRVKEVLVALCNQIEVTRPADLTALYRLTHVATERINDLQEAFEDEDSELETVAREVIAADFAAIAAAYGFADADVEELIAPRDW
ncbi:MAG: hypothetical protein EP329_24775 [Deltaproteobacteria bacterium]|nr:MAG: hypothetical protein EP329_24775 [Deltaproteobacteria bacterium]